MTRAQNVLARQWKTLAVAAVLLVLAGAVAAVWLRIDAEVATRRAAIAEADRRGSAVTTLAGDVRTLREQIKAEGKTPAVPDPGRKVDDLADRTEVPVPIPGPRGPAGADATPVPGTPGKDGTNGRDGASVTGPPGEAGDSVVGPQGPPGKDGTDGTNGRDGTDGKDGRDGQTCPDGYSLQPPPGDPDALVCRRDNAPDPEPDPEPSSSAPQPGVLGDRRRA